MEGIHTWGQRNFLGVIIICSSIQFTASGELIRMVDIMNDLPMSPQMKNLNALWLLCVLTLLAKDIGIHCLARSSFNHLLYFLHFSTHSTLIILLTVEPIEYIFIYAPNFFSMMYLLNLYILYIFKHAQII